MIKKGFADAAAAVGASLSSLWVSHVYDVKIYDIGILVKFFHFVCLAYFSILLLSYLYHCLFGLPFISCSSLHSSFRVLEICIFFSVLLGFCCFIAGLSFHCLNGGE